MATRTDACPSSPTPLYRTLRNVLVQGGMDEGEARAVTLLMLEKVAGMSTAETLSNSPKGEKHREELLQMAERVAKGEPVQYVLGRADFCGLSLYVDSQVLIPRCETEELVVWAVETAHKRTCRTERPLRILDIGTGSGCIALALAKQIEDANVEAWDVSEEALSVAHKNAATLKVDVTFRKVDILGETLPRVTVPYDIVISNPPYICEEEASDMEANVRCHEPHLALFVPNNDPLLFYRHIARQSLHLLAQGGALLFEVNRRFAEDCADLLRHTGYNQVEIRRDIFGNDRMVKAINEGSLSFH